MSPGEKKKRNIKASAKLGMHKHADEFLYIYPLASISFVSLFVFFFPCCCVFLGVAGGFASRTQVLF